MDLRTRKELIGKHTANPSMSDSDRKAATMLMHDLDLELALLREGTEENLSLERKQNKLNQVNDEKNER